MADTKKTKFEQALSLNVNEKTEQKNKLTYLTWSWAWAEFKKIYPEATYEVKLIDGKPFSYDKQLGYMVFTEVTADNMTYGMWLPVMDGANNAMKDEPYTYEVKDWYESKRQGKDVMIEKSVKSATMFDVNKAIMRCLTKNLAMFGLGLYIYAGEDLPEEETEDDSVWQKKIDAIKTVEEGREYYKKSRGKGKDHDKYLQDRMETLKAEYEDTSS